MSVHEVTNDIELSSAIDILADAFSDDPELMYLVQRTKNAFPFIRKFFQQLLPFIHKEKAHILIGDNKDSALVWWKDSEDPIGFSFLGQILHHIKSYLEITGGWKGLYRCLMDFQITESAQPDFPHIYVYVLGVKHSEKQKGLGSKLMRHLTDYADEHNYPIYLESTKEINLQFYKKHGFVVLERVQQYDDCPYYWTLLRPVKHPSQPIGTDSDN